MDYKGAYLETKHVLNELRKENARLKESLNACFLQLKKVCTEHSRCGGRFIYEEQTKMEAVK